jgi:hypothetical protein
MKQSWGQRIEEEKRRRMMGQPKKKSEPWTDEDWFGFFMVLTFGVVVGFAVGAIFV